MISDFTRGFLPSALIFGGHKNGLLRQSLGPRELPKLFIELLTADPPIPLIICLVSGLTNSVLGLGVLGRTVNLRGDCVTSGWVSNLDGAGVG